jgi:hypothetical protein
MFLRYSHKLNRKNSIEKYNSNDLKSCADGWVKFFVKFFFGSILISFMNELNNFFPIKLPKDAIWNDENCIMGLIKNYKFVIHKDKDMNFSMVC